MLKVYSQEPSGAKSEPADTATARKGFAPIPYVHTEARLVGSCWGRVDTSVHTAPAVALHLACHGDLATGPGDDDCLILSSTERMKLSDLLGGLRMHRSCT